MVTNFRYDIGQMIKGVYIDFIIVGISELRAFDYEVKFSYDLKRHPRGAIKIDGKFWLISEKHLYDEETRQQGEVKCM